MSNPQEKFIEELKKQEARSALTHLIKKVGFTGIISSLAELAQEHESIIRRRNDSYLSSCLETVFLLLMSTYPRATKKDQKLIRQVLTGEHFGEGLKLINWDSPLQSEAMKEAYALINSWKAVDKTES